MSEPTDGWEPILNPTDLEAAIQLTMHHIARGVNVVTGAETAFSEADRAYDRAFAQAYLAAEGPQYAKKYHAELATENERDARDVAEVAYHHAQRVAKALESKLTGWQAVNKSMISMLSGPVGVGG